MQKIWRQVKETIQKQAPDHTYKMWIEPLTYKKTGDDSILIICPNLFSKKRVQDHYLPVITESLNEISGRRLTVALDTADTGRPEKMQSKQMQLALPNINPVKGHFLRKSFTFDEFVVSGNNDFAYSASLSLASRKNSNHNFLFLLSKTGMGKSHLSQAIGHHVLSQNPSERVYYTTADDFSNEMVNAFRSNSINAFKKKYRDGCDVLLFEDVHHLSGKDRTQKELALILDALVTIDKKTIFSSCCLPSEIPKLNDILRSRLLNGLISNIEPPNFRTRTRILKKKLQSHGPTHQGMSEDVIQYLAGELTDDVRQLESGLMGVLAKSSLLGSPMDLNLAESVVKTIAKAKTKITADVIKRIVCKYYSVSATDIASASRKQTIVRPRQVAIYLSRKYTDLPLQKIGKKYNRYHATVLHSITSIERALKQGGALCQQIKFLCEKIESDKS